MTSEAVFARIEALASGKSHNDENFPVAWILAPAQRPVTLAFYRFVRLADDIADNASLPAQEKLMLLGAMADALRDGDVRWPCAKNLRENLDRAGVSDRHAFDLIDAFRRDCVQNRTRDFDDLMDYCRLSAMPVGRFLLDAHGEDRSNWPASDALCAALQIINHLQDCGKDFRTMDRVYVPDDVLARHGGAIAMLGADKAAPPLRATIVELSHKTATLLEEAAPLARRTRNRRLALNVAAIQALAQHLTQTLARRDPLSENVHVGKARFAAIAFGAVLREQMGRWLRPQPPEERDSI